MPSSIKSTTFHPITPISDFTIGFGSAGKEKDDTLEKSNSSNVHTYIDSAYNKVIFVNLKNEILQSLQGDIKILFDNEFTIFKLRCKDPVAKSNTRFQMIIIILYYKRSYYK